MGVDRVIDITAEEREVVLDLLQRYLPGVEAWVYGSRAKWTSQPQSDLDLVVFATPEQSRGVGDLREAFEESNLPFRVDLFVWSEVPEQFHQEIERDHVVLVMVKSVPVSVDVNWPKVTLGDCIEINDSTYSPKEAWSFFNYLDTGNITENCISEIQHLKTGIDTIPSRARRKVRSGDIVYSTVRPNQKHFGYLKKVPENFLVSTGFSVIRGISSVACTDYIYWFLAQSHIVDYLHTIAEHSASAYPSIRPTDIESLTLRLPPISEQHAIAHILGTLDDKIELNRRMNKTLEAMAHALFKSWFVDFDPVRAKMALKQHATNHPPLKESANQEQNPQENLHGGTDHHSPLEGESAKQEPVPGLTGEQGPQASRWGEIKRSYPEKTLNRAKSLRQNQTDAESLLWRYLRNKQLDGYKFRRQQPIGPYIIDFACLPEKLLIELDGGQHAEHEVYDERRDRFLQSKGYRVLRFWNNEVFENCFDVLEHIYQALTSPDHSPLEESANQERNPQENLHGGTDHHSPLEGESAKQGRQPAGAPVGENVLTSNYQVAETDAPPPHQPSPDGSSSATPPQGGSDWTVERARAYLDRMDPKIADLFPDRLVVSDIGEIPEGWKKDSLGKLFDVTIGRTPPRKESHHFVASGQGRTWLSIKSMGKLQTFAFSSEKDLTSEAVKQYRVPLVPSGAVLVSFKLTVGRVAIAARSMHTNEAIAHLIAKDDTPVSNVFTYCFMKNFDFESLGSTSSIATAVSSKSIKGIEMILPQDKIHAAFVKTIQPTFARILSSVRQNEVLATIRDAVLPKLICGQLQIEPKLSELLETA